MAAYSNLPGSKCLTRDVNIMDEYVVTRCLPERSTLLANTHHQYLRSELHLETLHCARKTGFSSSVAEYMQSVIITQTGWP